MNERRITKWVAADSFLRELRDSTGKRVVETSNKAPQGREGDDCATILYDDGTGLAIVYHEGYPGYSEFTPDEDASVDVYKLRWEY